MCPYCITASTLSLPIVTVVVVVVDLLQSYLVISITSMYTGLEHRLHQALSKRCPTSRRFTCVVNCHPLRAFDVLCPPQSRSTPVSSARNQALHQCALQATGTFVYQCNIQKILE